MDTFMTEGFILGFGCAITLAAIMMVIFLPW